MINRPNAVQEIIDLACQSQFVNMHEKSEQVDRVQEKLCTVRQEVLRDGYSLPLKRAVLRSVNMIESRLIEDNMSWFDRFVRSVPFFRNFFVPEFRTEFVPEFRTELGRLLEDQENDLLCEEEARLHFFSKEARKLGIKKSAEGDLEAIKLCSKTFWECSKNYGEYAKHMKAYFCGEHFLIADDGALNQELAQLEGVHLRSSSHYDFGSKDHTKGGAVPENEQAANDAEVYPQYEITGPQVKALLFSKVCLKILEGVQETTIFSKTPTGKVEIIKPNMQVPLPHAKTFSWLQAEWAPDSANWREADFWKHRVFSFGLYVIRKLLKLETPNIGPYGYGHGDLNAGGVGPTILYPKPR